MSEFTTAGIIGDQFSDWLHYSTDALVVFIDAINFDTHGLSKLVAPMAESSGQ